MKKVYRREDNARYWDRRWAEAGEDADQFDDMSIYPIRYSEMVMQGNPGAALEIGCGLGRLLKHYHGKGFRISGIERSTVAVEQLRTQRSDLDVVAGDVMALPHEASSFDVVMAFGVYHNLETGLEQAIEETARVLKPGGRFVISMRPNNIEMHLNECYWNWRNRVSRSAPRAFHKLLVGPGEFSALLASAGLRTDKVFYARNVSILYRVPFLRASSSVQVEESVRRASGYRLSALGRILDGAMTGVAPYQTCNVLVFLGTKELQA